MAYRSISPVTGQLLRTFSNHSDSELQSALTVAHSLYESDWSRGSRQRRIEVLASLADSIEQRAEELARILVQEMGKRISEARWEVKVTTEIASNIQTDGLIDAMCPVAHQRGESRRKGFR